MHAFTRAIVRSTRSATSALVHSRCANLASSIVPSVRVASLMASSTGALHSSAVLPVAAAAVRAAVAPRQLAQLGEAVEILDAQPAIPTRLMMTCEHASMRLPAPWKWPSEDNRLLGQHWSFDPGAEDFTRELHARVSSVAVLGRFSRLLCDPNRAVGSDTMFRDVADSLPVHLNAKGKLDGDEVKKRLDALYYPYHQALKKVFDAVQPTIILSPHSFTPVYEGQRRSIEIGVLYNPEKDRALANKFVAAYTAAGIVTALNAPWSAKDGFMYAVDQFSNPATRSIMFEFRQDLIVDKAWREKVVAITEKVLREEGHNA